MTSVKDILEQLSEGKSLEEVLRGTLSPELATTLDRCAWVRSFDADVFAILRDSPAVAFEQVIASPDVEPVPKRAGFYRVRPEVRDAALRRLAPPGEDLGPLRELSARLADHFRARGFPHDQLDQLIVADPRRARGLLCRLYAAADSDFDVLRCRALLDLAHAREPHDDWQLVDTINDLERYFTARSHWRDHYRKATRFYRPPEVDAAFERLLDDGPPTLLITGENGLGKSIHVLHLITRLAVTQPRRLSCGLVDFGLMQLGNVQRDTWLVLIEIAYQLNQQLDEPLFDEFLSRHGRLRARALRPQLAVEASVPDQLPDSEDDLQRLGEVVRDDFYCVAKPPEVARRILIAFDALESLTDVVAAGIGKRRLLEELVNLRQQLPEARMVFAGQSTPDLETSAARFEPYARLELQRLGRSEARAYLTDGRKLPVSEDVIEAALDAAGADDGGAAPLRLAMIADAIERRPDLDADVVRALDEPALFILIEQIVVGIDDIRVRWLLRYGIVPRLLTRGFVADVLAPLVAEAVHGASADDDPSQDPRLGQQTPSATPFLIDPTAKVDTDGLWGALWQYAADYSWIEPVDADTLRFHETVLRPMREVLRAQPVFKTLHRAAREYFETRAEREPDARPRLQREAFYHDLQLDAKAAIAHWQDITRSMATDPEVAAALAEELLDYSRCGLTLVGPALVAQVRTERALANLRRATAPGAKRGGWLWDLAREDVEAAEAFGGERDVRLVAGRAALLIRDGAIDEALKLVESWLSTELRPEDEMILHVRAGDAYAERDSDKASEHYVAALALGHQTNGRPADLGMLLWKHASALARRDDVARARIVVEDCLELAPESSPVRAAAHLLRGQLALRQGEATAAVADAEVAARHGGRLRHEADLLRARAALAVWDAEAAQQRAEEALQAANGHEDNSAEAGIELAEAYELRADVRAALLDVRGAQADLEDAAKVWNAISGDGVARCFAAIARVLMREHGSTRRAALALQRAEAAGSRRVADRTDVRLRQAEWRALSEKEGPEQLIEEVLKELRKDAAALGLRGRAALAGLCLPNIPPQRTFLEALVKVLAPIEPAIARLTMLDDLERCPSLERLRRGDLRKLYELLAPDEVLAHVRTLPPPEQRAALVRLAHVARVTGKGEAARARLGEALVLDLELGPTSLAHRRVRHAAALLGDDAIVARLGPSKLPARRVTEHAALDTPSTFRTVEKLLPRDAGSLAEVIGGAAIAGKLVIGWSRLRNALRQRVEALRPLAGGATVEELSSALVMPPALRPQIRTDHPTIEVLLQLEDDRIITRVVTPEGRAKHTVDTRNVVVEALVRQVRAAAGEAAVSGVFTKPDVAGPALAALLFGPDRPEQLRSGEPHDIRLWTPDALLGQVPWELACWGSGGPLVTEDPRVRHLYRGVLEAAESAEGRRVTTRTAVVVRPRTDGVGAITSSLVDVEDAYTAAGFEVRVLESAPPPQIASVLRDTCPAVLHIAAGLVDDGLGVAIDVAGGVAGEVELPHIRRDRVTTTGLALALAAVPPPGPVIVLDPPAMRHTAVSMSQLLLRNAFAADLASSTRIPAVIGTGLVRRGVQDALYRWLPRALAAGSSAAEVVAGIRTLQAPARGRDALGLSVTALFAARVAAPMAPTL